MQPAQTPKSEITLPYKPSLKGLLNIPYGLAVGAVATAIASIVGGWLACIGICLAVGLFWGLFFDSKNVPPAKLAGKDGQPLPKQYRIAVFALGFVFVGVPWFILYAISTYALADHLKPVAISVLLGAYAWSVVREQIAGMRAVRKAKALAKG